MLRDVISFNGIFNIFPLVGLFKLAVYFKDLSMNIKAIVSYDKIIFFVLIQFLYIVTNMSQGQ